MIYVICSFSECDRKVRCKKLCSGHYKQTQVGIELRPLTRTSLTFEERFWSNVNKAEKCWLWTGDTNGKGYGRITSNNRRIGSHVASWEITNGSVPEGYKVDHKCHTKNCVKPTHLRLLTHSENGSYRKGPQINNTSGVLGVNWVAQKAKWEAKFQTNGQHFHLGFFDELDEAERELRKTKENVLGFPDYEKQKELI